MLEKIYDLSPGVTITLATLHATIVPHDKDFIEAANIGYRELIQDLQSRQRKIELAEMYNKWFTPKDHSDPIHFNSGSYDKMAAIFTKAFDRFEEKG